MGAGLAAQRGWPQQGEDVQSDSNSGEAASSPNPNLGVFDKASRDETQPLEDGEGWGDYLSTSSLTSLVPVELRRPSQDPEDNGEGGGGGPLTATDVAGEDELLRESRAPSIAYDLGALSTEEEVSWRDTMILLLERCDIEGIAARSGLCQKV